MTQPRIMDILGRRWKASALITLQALPWQCLLKSILLTASGEKDPKAEVNVSLNPEEGLRQWGPWSCCQKDRE